MLHLIKRGLQFWLVFLFFIFTILFGPSDSLAAEKKTLTWGSTASTSGSFVYYVVSAKILNEKIPEINVSVRSTGASVHNARLLEKQEVEIGSVDTRTAWEAIHGKGTFEGKPFPDLRLLHVITWTNPMQFVVSEKSGIKNIYGVEGKPFTPGMLGSSAERMAMETFRTLGISPKLRHSSYADALEAMKNEMIVGFGKLGAPDASILDIMSVMKIRILSLSDEDIEKILRNVPGVTKTVVPSGIYQGIGEFKTFENQYCDFVRKDFPAELAYKIVKTMWENRADIKRAWPLFSGDQLIEVSLRPKTSVYFHPGAVKFYRELGYTVPTMLVPPEMGEK